MRLFLLTTFTFWSFISSGQTSGKTSNDILFTYNSPGLHYAAKNSYSFSLKPGCHSKIEPTVTASTTANSINENTTLPLQKAIATDSSIQTSLDYQMWYKISLVEFGINYTTAFTSASTSNKLEYAQALINYSMGFRSLGGLGFGTKLIVYYPVPGNVEIHSWVPLYTYFPVYISRKKTKPFARVPNTYNVPFMINLYAGGSLWSTTSSSYSISKGAFLPDKYYQIGVNCLFFNFSLNHIGLLNGNFAFDTGMIFYKNKDGALTSVFNLGLIYSFAGSTRIMYK